MKTYYFRVAVYCLALLFLTFCWVVFMLGIASTINGFYGSMAGIFAGLIGLKYRNEVLEDLFDWVLAARNKEEVKNSRWH